LTKLHIGAAIIAVVGIGLLLHRRLRPLAWAAIALAVCAGLAFVARSTWLGEMIASFDLFTARTGWTFPINGYQDNPTAYAALLLSAEAGPVLLAAVAAILGAIVLLAVRRARRRERLSLQWFGALGCATVFFLVPYARAYDLMYLLWPAVYFMFSDEIQASVGVRIGLGALLYFAPMALLLIGGQGVSSLTLPIIMTAAILLTPTQDALNTSAT
jgi:hypothetical protein